MLLVTLAASVLGSDRAFIITLDKYKSRGTHWIALYVNTENVTYFEQKNTFIKTCSLYQVQNPHLLKGKKLKEIVRNKSTDSK